MAETIVRRRLLSVDDELPAPTCGLPLLLVATCRSRRTGRALGTSIAVILTAVPSAGAWWLPPVRPNG